MPKKTFGLNAYNAYHQLVIKRLKTKVIEEIT